MTKPPTRTSSATTATIPADARRKPPANLEASARKALEVADEYVWIYTEQPRWWSDTGQTVKLPAAYVNALSNARNFRHE